MKEDYIKVIILNPPTKEQMEKRTKELTLYLQEIFASNLSNSPKRR